MAYGAGRSRLYAAYGKEQAKERKQYEKDIAAAERARRIQSERKGLLGMLGTVVGGALLGPVGMIAGQALGKFAGDRGTIGGKQAEEYKVSTETGQFGRSQVSDLKAINRELTKADKADIWRDVVDLGTTAMTAWTMGGGSFKDPGNFSLTKFGGKDAVEAGGYGKGVFGKAGGGYGLGGDTLWGQLGSKTAASSTASYVKPDILETPISGVLDQSRGRLQLPGFTKYEGRRNPYKPWDKWRSM